MTQEALSSDVVDKFFESQGEESPQRPKDEVSVEGGLNELSGDISESNTNPQEEQKDATESEIDRNLRAALTEERERRKELQRERQELVQQKQKMEEAFQRFLESQQQKTLEPSFDDDPIEATRYKLSQHEQALQQFQQAEVYRQQQAEMTRAQQEFANHYQMSAYEFSQKQPDFKDAYQYLMQQRLSEYTAAGYKQEEANRLLIEDELAIASRAFQDNASPAERIFNLAKLRGYQGAQPNAESKINQIQKTVSASKSLGNTSGKTTKGFSLEALASLSKEELDEVVNKEWDKIARSMS